MERILKAGSSVMMFPEGMLNNSENLYSLPLFPGIWYIARETNTEIVPIVSHSEHSDKKIWIAAGEPLDFSSLEKDDALIALRDALSTLRFEICEHAYPIQKRAELHGDLHKKHLYNRMDTYLETKWYEPNWSEEMLMYKNRKIVFAEDVRSELDSVTVTAENAGIIAPVLAKRQEDIERNLVGFMNEHWDEPQRR